MTIILSEAAYDAFNPKPTGIRSSEAAKIVGRIFGAVDADPQADADHIWLRYQNTLLPREMLERIYWLVHPERMQDLNDNVVNSLRRTMLAGDDVPSRVITPALNADEGRMLLTIMRRIPYIMKHTSGRPMDMIEPDQMALLFHLYRLGASRDAINHSFEYSLHASTINAIQTAMRKHFVQTPGWRWRDELKPPRVRR